MSTRMGTIAEHKFELMCLEMDIPIFKPVLDNYSIDFVIQKNKRLLRIQVKSTQKKDPARNAYKINAVRGFDGRKYKNGDFDFYIIYIFEISLWYIIPQREVTARTIRLNPESENTKFSKYKEAWHLLV